MPRFGLIQTVSDYYLARALTNGGQKPLNVREFMFMADRLDELRARREASPPAQRNRRGRLLRG